MGGRAMIEIIIISIVWAILRSKNDSYLREGKWKLWSFLMATFVAGIVGYHLHGISFLTLIGMAVFGLIFWIAFDIFTGIIFGKHPLYIGTTGFDAKVRKVFCYTDKWKATNYLIFKLVWLTITIKFYTL
jgi:hypothetical protein